MPKFKETDNFIVDLRQQAQAQSKIQKPGIPAERIGKRQEEYRSLDEQIIEAGIQESEEQEPRRFFVSADMKTKSWLDFIKYNNAFLIVLAAGVIAFSGLALASEEVRDNTIGGKQVYAEGVDNTLLLEQNFDEFKMDYKITGITEDEESYVVTYSYVDFNLSSSDIGSRTPRGESDSQTGSVWQFIEKQGARKINKPFRQDLGVYLAEQLSQEAKARLKELKKLQKEEQEKGETKIVQVTKYSGLIGKVLDLSGEVFPGYEPIKKIELATPEAEESVLRRASSGGDNLNNVYSEWVEEHPEEVANLNNTNEHGLETDQNGSQINTDEAVDVKSTNESGNTETSGGEASVEEESADETPIENPAPEPEASPEIGPEIAE